MGNHRKWYFKMAVIIIVLMIAALACSVQLSNPTTDSTFITQTFAALGTEMAALENQPVVTGETPSAEAPAAEAPTITTAPPVVHAVTPPEPSNLAHWITDKSDEMLASQHRANGGENFDANIFERPFTSGSMDYLPDLDIVEVEFSRSGDWVFVNLIMSGQNPAGGMKGVYGIEVDSNMNGRGDFIIYAITPAGTTWSTVGVKAYEDTEHNVGGGTVLIADPYPGNGYETILFDEGYINDPDAAWARIAPSNPNAIQLAFKYALIRNNDKYMFGAWSAVPEMVNPAWFDYNDHFTHADAGSPLSELPAYYPLKAFYGWDNTCRWVVGIKNPTGKEPGLCPYTPPTVAPPTAIPTLTPYIIY